MAHVLEASLFSLFNLIKGNIQQFLTFFWDKTITVIESSLNPGCNGQTGVTDSAVADRPAQGADTYRDFTTLPQALHQKYSGEHFWEIFRTLALWI